MFNLLFSEVYIFEAIFALTIHKQEIKQQTFIAIGVMSKCRIVFARTVSLYLFSLIFGILSNNLG
jgi:hypothetical protein